MEKNVEEFLNEMAKMVGSISQDNFQSDMKCEFEDLNITSPIEQLLYCALNAQMEISGERRDPVVEIQGKTYMIGIDIKPQEKIGKYRVDFLITSYDRGEGKTQTRKSLIVECDSQEWHERTESERRYEKRRDRYLQNQGYKVFHYTGKEIMEDAFNIAQEIFRFLDECEVEITG